MLQMPNARSSALASIVSPLRAAKVRPVSALSENATIAMPTAGINNPTSSDAVTAGMLTFGRPAGIPPTTRIPLASSENHDTTAVAARTAISGPGNRGDIR